MKGRKRKRKRNANENGNGNGKRKKRELYVEVRIGWIRSIWYLLGPTQERERYLHYLRNNIRLRVKRKRRNRI